MTTTETTNAMKTEIPAKAWNEMKGVMEDTSLPEWQKYYADLKEHDERMSAKMPKPEHYGWSKESGWASADEGAYLSAMYQWSFESGVNAPNKPGYYRANND